MVWGKGGGTVDTANDLIYLANYCPVFPYAPDLPGLWAGLSHGAVIIPVNGEPILITESPAVRRDIVSVQDVRSADGFVPDKVAATLREMVLGIIIHENGGNPYPSMILDEGIRRALS